METRLTELHILDAIDRALRLFCTASTIIPEEYGPQITEQTVRDLAEFALHARRVNDLCNLRSVKFNSGSNSRYIVDVYPAPLENDYHEALNRLMHARTYAMGYSIWDGEKIFLSSENNIIPTYVKIETDRKPSACVNIFALSNCFLTEVIPHIKTHHPSIKF